MLQVIEATLFKQTLLLFEKYGINNNADTPIFIFNVILQMHIKDCKVRRPRKSPMVHRNSDSPMICCQYGRQSPMVMK